MRVYAAAGLKCPMEGQPRKYITVQDAGSAVDVPETTYYLRLVRDGSLVRAPEAQAMTKTGGK